jgi:hypothetical protein
MQYATTGVTDKKSAAGDANALAVYQAWLPDLTITVGPTTFGGLIRATKL